MKQPLSLLKLATDNFEIRVFLTGWILKVLEKHLNKRLEIWANMVKRKEKVYRNGYRMRNLLTPIGWVKLRMLKFRKRIKTE